ncbi:MAG: DUF4984 domain-containing protein [Candidatus Cryptobacteroides sp.]
MKKTLYTIAVLAAALVSCSRNPNIYDADEYVMFADTLKVYPVQDDDEWFSVPVVSTVKRNYDRTFGVEIIDSESDAVEKLQYGLKSNTVTIKAGEVRTDVLVRGVYENLDPAQTPQFTLSLVMPDELEMPAYGRRTKVLLQKCCPFDVNSFTGWCVLSSTFLQSYNPYGSYQRLVKSELNPDKENSIICRDWMLKGYDIEMTFDASDLLAPTVDVPEGQVMSDEGSFFGMTHGDDRILIRTSSYAPSYFSSCGNYLYVWTQMYVYDLNTYIGSVGHFYTVMEWVSDEEARRLRNEGMACDTKMD